MPQMCVLDGCNDVQYNMAVMACQVMYIVAVMACACDIYSGSNGLCM